MRWHHLTARARVLPDFVIIGAQKCGTSSLYAYLTQHPNVMPALEKEVHYFDSNYDKGIAWYKAHFVTSAYRAVQSFRTGQKTITGEASPYYLIYPHAPARLRAVLPAAKLIVLLRNPVDRAYSHYQHQVARGRESLSFEDALRAEQKRLDGEYERMMRDEHYTSFAHAHYSYLLRGIYADQLALWFEVFPREQFLVLSAESLFADASVAVKQTLAYLELPYREIDVSQKRNARSYSSMNASTRRLLVDYFRPHNARLYELLNDSFEWDT
jgi:hypothetical protein